ncbi:MAG: hypothetical protein KME03_01845 [Aphanocapsa lilacina HA4352-LM1]|nr:hypothetical protein [Aphanocapsa lilacina HA4352-LM1]
MPLPLYWGDVNRAEERGMAELSWEQRVRVATRDVTPQLQKLLANLGGTYHG